MRHNQEEDDMSIASEMGTQAERSVGRPVVVHLLEFDEASLGGLARYVVVQVPSGEPLPAGLETLTRISSYSYERSAALSESAVDDLLSELKGEVEFIEDANKRALCILRMLVSKSEDEELFEETWWTGLRPEEVTPLKADAEARGEFAFFGVSEFVVEREVSRFLASRECFAQSHRQSSRKTG